MRNQKGITLIALVITIIVLIILAGVSITALTDEDKGVVTKAKQAALATEEAEGEEDEDIGELLDYTDVELGDAIIIGNDKITKDNLGTYLGREVVYVPSNPSTSYGTSTIYRLFYIDFDNEFGDGKGTIYLKADADTNKDALNKYINYESTDELEVMKKLNSGWANSKETVTLLSEKCVSALLDPNLWSGWIDTTTEGIKNKVNYVVGGPSLEMYVKSYNEYVNDSTKSIACEYTTDSSYDANGYRIGLKNVESGSWSNLGYDLDIGSLIDSSGRNIMYNPGEDYYYWIASPSANDSELIMCVSGVLSHVEGLKYNNAYVAFCPFVSLQSDATLTWK